MGNILTLPSTLGPVIGASNNATKSSVALTTAYTYNSAGNAVGLRFSAPVTANLTDVYFFVTVVNGSPGNLTVEVRNASTGSSTQPGSTLHTSQSISPGTSTNVWVRCTLGTPYGVTQGTQYWVVVGDAAGNGTNNVSILSTAGLTQGNNLLRQVFNPYTTTNGFNTAATAVNVPGPFVLVFDDAAHTVIGNPYTNNTNDTNNALMRGIYLAGLTERKEIIGLSWVGQGISTVTGMKVFSGATAPGGTADYTVTFAANAAYNACAYFAPITLFKGVPYRIVLTFSGNFTQPGYYIAEDTAQSDVMLTTFLGGRAYYTISDGGTPAAWTDYTGRFPKMVLIEQDQVSIARVHGS